jgi:hypothetical protein
MVSLVYVVALEDWPCNLKCMSCSKSPNSDLFLSAGVMGSGHDVMGETSYSKTELRERGSLLTPPSHLKHLRSLTLNFYTVPGWLLLPATAAVE